MKKLKQLVREIFAKYENYGFSSRMNEGTGEMSEIRREVEIIVDGCLALANASC